MIDSNIKFEVPERQQHESSLHSSLSCSPASQSSVDLNNSMHNNNNNLKQSSAENNSFDNSIWSDYDMKSKSNRLV